ncbi:MAG: DUF4350 domain-containing protein [Luteimonas sp.]
MKVTRANATLTALVLAGGALWWWQTFKRVERWVDLPPRGEASYNPLYALKLSLLADGVAARSRQRLRLDTMPLGARDTLLIWNDPRALPDGDAHALLAWVESGGHLIVRTPPPALNPQTIGAFGLLSALNVRPLPHAACMPLQVAAEHAHVEFCRGARFALRRVTPRLRWSDASGTGFARLDRGRGSVDVLSDLDFLGNAQLRDGPHLALARQLLQPNYRAGVVHLVYAAEMPPLWRLLLERAWMAWLPLLLAVCAWLWTRSQRFGPLRPSPPGHRAELLEHIRASGEHLHRYRQTQVLYAAMREAFFSRLRRRDPLAAAIDGAAQIAAIAERADVSATEVAAALKPPRIGDAADFRFRVARLIQLRNRL